MTAPTPDQIAQLREELLRYYDSPAGKAHDVGSRNGIAGMISALWWVTDGRMGPVMTRLVATARGASA